MENKPSSLADRELSIVAGVAAATSSGASVLEGVQESLEQIRRLFPFDAGILSVRTPGTNELRTVLTTGYSDSFSAYLNSPSWYEECIAPFGVPRTGWPVRESDLPVDPMSLRGIAEYGRPEGLYEGLLSALITPSGRHVGFLMLSWASALPPSEQVCAVIGHVSQAMANMVDPLRSARSLVATLDDDVVAVGLLSNRTAVPLRGAMDPELLVDSSPVYELAERALHGTSLPFLQPSARGGWYRCTVYGCRDGVAVLAARKLADVHRLTRRELEVLKHLAEGCSNSEIAELLCVTIRTVRAHVEHILEKLGVSTRSAAVAHALSEGLLVLDGAPLADS